MQVARTTKNDNDNFPWEDCIKSAIIAGLRNVCDLSRTERALWACLQGININEATKFMSGNSELTVDEFILTIAAQCGIPAVFEALTPNQSGRLYEAIRTSSSSKVAKFLNKWLIKAGNDIEGTVKAMAKKTSRTGKYWEQQLIQLGKTDYGKRAFAIIANIDFDFSKISARNFKRLVNVIEKHGDNAAENILRKTVNENLDINRMLIFMEHGAAPDFLEAAVNQIGNSTNAAFTKTITVNGKTMKLSEFFNKHTDMNTSYYYKLSSDDKHHFIKWHEVIKEGIEIVFDFANKTVLETESKFISNSITNYIDENYQKEVLKDSEENNENYEEE